MLADSESRVVGPLVVAVGTAFFAAGLARLIWPVADGMIYLASLGIGFGFPLLASGLWSIRADMRRLGADLADREAERAVKLATVDYQPEPAAPVDSDDPKEPVDVAARANEQRRAHWDVFWQRYFAAGDAYGFTNSNLTTEGSPTRVLSDDAWKKVTPYAVYSGVLIGGKPGRSTKWAESYNMERFQAEHLWKLLPHPTFEPPEIAEGPYHATPPRPDTPRATPRKSDASRAVIDA